jgi:hypothetical protein
MPQPYRLIGLTGYAQSGKDTAAKILIENGYTRVAFADALRNMLYALNPIVIPGTSGMRVDRLQYLVDKRGWEVAKRQPEVRQLLQRLGTEAGRKVLGENIWIETALRGYTSHSAPVVITDVRFDNEAQAVVNAGGHVIKIERPGYARVNSHVSDAGIDPALLSATIVNDGTVKDLHSNIIAFVRGRA